MMFLGARRTVADFLSTETSTEASALATAPVAVLGARLQWAPRDPPATLFVRAADLAAAAAADAGDAVARTLDMLVGDGTVGP